MSGELTARALLTDPRRFKLGLFSLNASGGIAMTRVPERWRAEWPDIVRAAQMADQAGLDFLLPLQRWRGYGGETDPRGVCMECATHSAALASLTKRIAVFSTFQTSIIAPAWAARSVATLDQVSGGRAGLNIVCGWNEKDFAMFGKSDVGADRRFDQGTEWTEVLTRLLAGGEPFEHSGEFFQISGAHCSPLPLQPGGIPLMSAAFSPVGREFAARFCDVLFTTISSIDNGRGHVKSLDETAAKYGRKIDVFTPLHVVCRPTREEAESYYNRFAIELADTGAVENYIAENSRAGKPALATAMRMQRKRIAGGFGSYGVAGSPADIAEQLIAMHQAGFGGASISFVNFTDELQFFLDTVVPILAKAGLR